MDCPSVERPTFKPSWHCFVSDQPVLLTPGEDKSGKKSLILLSWGHCLYLLEPTLISPLRQIIKLLGYQVLGIKKLEYLNKMLFACFSHSSSPSVSSDAPPPTWEQLEKGLVAVKTVVHGLVDFIQNHSKKGADPQQVSLSQKEQGLSLVCYCINPSYIHERIWTNHHHQNT